MTFSISAAVRSDRLQALTRAIDGGAGPGLLKIYDGSRPSAGGEVTTQQLLATQPFGDPSAGSVSGGTLTLNIAASVLASKTGNASWARITDSAGTFVADMDVTALGGSGEVQLSAGGTPTIQIYEGGVFSISVATLVEA